MLLVPRPQTAMSTPDQFAAQAGPLSGEQKQQLAEARERARELLRPGRSAARSAAVSAVLAGLSLLIGLVSLTSLVVGAGLAVVAVNEWRGARLLRAFDPRGPRLLAFNQLWLMALLVGYGAWGLYTGLTGPGPYDAYPELASMLPSRSELHRITWVLYGGLIVLALLIQGRKARNSFAHEARLRDYVDATPAWIVELQRTALLD
jgi:hypothetical protein